MYLRWEYSDIMHYFSRILFHMNPDGNESGRALRLRILLPDRVQACAQFRDSSKIVGIGGGHHGRGDTGAFIIDPTIA